MAFRWTYSAVWDSLTIEKRKEIDKEGGKGQSSVESYYPSTTMAPSKRRKILTMVWTIILISTCLRAVLWLHSVWLQILHFLPFPLLRIWSLWLPDNTILANRSTMLLDPFLDLLCLAREGFRSSLQESRSLFGSDCNWLWAVQRERT